MLRDIFTRKNKYSTRTKKVDKNAIYKYILLYIKLSIIYIPLTIYGIYYFHKSSTEKIVVGIIRNYILVGEQFYSWPLWYLLSSIFALISFYFFMKNYRQSYSYGVPLYLLLHA